MGVELHHPLSLNYHDIQVVSMLCDFHQTVKNILLLYNLLGYLSF